MWCAKCGNELEDGAKFCGVCGAAVEAFEEDAPTESAELAVAEAAAAEQPAAEPVEAAAAEQPAAEPVETAAAEQPAAEPVEAAAAEQPAAEPVEAPAAEQPAAEPVETAAAEQPAAEPAAGDAPAEEPILGGKKKSAKTWIILGVAAVLVIAVIVGLVKLIPAIFGGGSGKAVYVYSTDDDELMFRKDLKVNTEPVELTDEGAGSVRFSKDGKYIYFFEEDDEGSSYADLYVIRTADVGKKNASPEKVSSDVYLYQLEVLDNGGVLYLKGDNRGTDLHYYNGKENSRLAKEVDSYTLDQKQNYVYYAEWDDSDYTETLYRIELKSGEKETLLKEVDAIYSAYDDEILVYGEDNGDGTYDVYSKKPGGDRQSLVKDVDYVMDTQVSGGKVSFLYAIEQEEEVPMYSFVSDRYASSDASARRPDTSDYQVYNSGYFYGWYSTDWDAYYAAMDEWYPIENRNSIRQDLQNWTYYIDYYEVYRYEDGNKTAICDRVSDIRYAEGEAIYLYQKYEGEVKEVVDLSELSYAGEVYDYLGSDESTWYQNVGGTESEFNLDDDYVYISDIYVLNGSEAVLEVRDEDYEYSLLSYSVGKTALSYQTEITDEYKSLTVTEDAKGRDVLYYYTDVSRDGESGDLICYDGSKTTVVKDVEIALVLDSGSVFCVEDREYDSRHGRYEYSLYSVDKDGKKTRIADDVTARAIISGKQVLYVSDEDLFVWDGKTSERLARDVVNIWASNRAELSTYWCEW